MGDIIVPPTGEGSSSKGADLPNIASAQADANSMKDALEEIQKERERMKEQLVEAVAQIHTAIKNLQANPLMDDPSINSAVNGLSSALSQIQQGQAQMEMGVNKMEKSAGQLDRLLAVQ